MKSTMLPALLLATCLSWATTKTPISPTALKAPLRLEVVDLESGLVLPFVNIVIKYKGEICTGIATDLDGQARLQLPDSFDLIQLSYLGYRTVELRSEEITPELEMGLLSVAMEESVNIICCLTSICVRQITYVLEARPLDEDILEIVVFPNPTTDLLHIQSEDTLETASLYSLKGDLVQQWTLDSQLQDHYIHVDHLPDGLYILKMSGLSLAESRQIIIQH